MKRRLLIGLAILAALAALVFGAWIGPRLIESPGYVLIEFGPWRIQMTAVVLIGAVIGVWVLTSIVVAVLRWPQQTVRRMRRARAQRSLDRGLLALSEGDWRQAERLLGRAMQGPDVGTAGYLAAARAAQAQSDPVQRDRYLAKAGRVDRRRRLSAGLLRARMLTEEGNYADAIELLEAYHLKQPRHQGVLKLLLECYQQDGRWHEVRLLLPALKRAGAFGQQRAEELEALAVARELEAADDLPSLDAVWKPLNRKMTLRSEVVAAYAHRALELDHASAVEPVLRRALNAAPDDLLLGLYAQADAADRQARIRQCENWLKKRDGSALRLALGRLYLDAREDEKARAHLEVAVQHSPDPQAYALLGRVLDRAGQLESATQCYRNALRLEHGRAPEPLPGPHASRDP